jgi:hypothetical protein
MHRIAHCIALFGLILVLVLAAGSSVSAAAPDLQQTAGPGTGTPEATPVPQAQILSPLPGQALQGGVQINGNTFVPGFRSAELLFTYRSAPGLPPLPETWFLIVPMGAPIANSVLALWDTTTISDGIYDLRLVVNLDNGEQDIVTIEGLRVRNYSAIETDTPTPVLPTGTPDPLSLPPATATPTPTITPVPPTPTDLPPNPAQLSNQQVFSSLGKGALAVIGFFALMGIYAAVGRIMKR